MSDRAAIIASLAPMFAEARRTGKWFHSSYQDLWFSPDDLEAEQRDGRFVWGAVNWSLRDPREQVAYHERRAREATAEAERLRAQLPKVLP